MTSATNINVEAQTSQEAGIAKSRGLMFVFIFKIVAYYVPGEEIQSSFAAYLSIYSLINNKIKQMNSPKNMKEVYKQGCVKLQHKVELNSGTAEVAYLGETERSRYLPIRVFAVPKANIPPIIE